MDMITCTVCKELKDKEFFSPSYIRSKDGATGKCKKCCNISYSSKKDIISEKRKYYYIRNKERIASYKLDRPEMIKRHHENAKLKIYGIDKDTYDTMFLLQNGVCSICHQSESVIDKYGNLRKLSIDHDHITGKVRGLLCTNCNNGLGRFKDNTEYLTAAISYLLAHKE